jgi:hypothetical protein
METIEGTAVVVRPKKVRAYTELLKSSRDAVERLKAEQAAVMQNRGEIDRIIGIARKVAPAHGYPPYLVNSTLYVRGIVSDLSGFKDRRLIKVMEKIEAAGIEFNDSSDYPEYMERTFRGKGQFGEIMVAITLDARLSDAPKNCRRVQVGVDRSVSETPRYEFVCD